MRHLPFLSFILNFQKAVFSPTFCDSQSTWFSLSSVVLFIFSFIHFGRVVFRTDVMYLWWETSTSNSLYCLVTFSILVEACKTTLSVWQKNVISDDHFKNAWSNTRNKYCNSLFESGINQKVNAALFLLGFSLAKGRFRGTWLVIKFLDMKLFCSDNFSYLCYLKHHIEDSHFGNPNWSWLQKLSTYGAMA